MKSTIYKATVFSLLLLITGSCTTTAIVGTKPTPPGQAKKETGSKSAKQFAPGQQKKKP